MLNIRQCKHGLHLNLSRSKCNHSEEEIMQDLQKLSGKQPQQTGESPVTITAVPILFFFFLKIFLNFYLFIYLFMAVLGLRFCARAFSSCGERGATLHRGVRASRYCGLSCCGAQAPDAQAQQLWLTGPVAPRHVGSSQTRARTRVPCIGRQILNHCATREAPLYSF